MAASLAGALDGLEALVARAPIDHAAVPTGVTIAAIAPGGTVVEAGLLAFVPTRAQLPEGPEGMFAAANRAAEIDEDTASARRLYRELAARPETSVRAKALVRLAALERRAGSSAGALRAYAVRAAANYPSVVAAIARVSGQGIVRSGAVPVVADCTWLADGIGHLTADGSAAVKQQLQDHYRSR